MCEITNNMNYYFRLMKIILGAQVPPHNLKRFLRNNWQSYDTNDNQTKNQMIPSHISKTIDISASTKSKVTQRYARNDGTKMIRTILSLMQTHPHCGSAMNAGS